MIVASTSLATTFFASLIAFTMEQEFGNIMSKDIGSILNDIPESWNDVTIQNLLDMATGHFRFSQAERDESRYSDDFENAQDHLTKLDQALKTYKRSTKPGTIFVYHSSDTYILGWALRVLLAFCTANKVEGVEMNFLSYFDSKILIPLRISAMTRRSIRNTNDSFLQPYSSSGLFFTIDDILKISRLVNPGSKTRGKINGQQVLNRGLLDKALQLNPSARGLIMENGNLYNKGLWAREFQFDDCEEMKFIPYTQGKGPSVVALFPNNATYISFSDSDIHDFSSWHETASEVARLHCKNIVSDTTLTPTFSPTSSVSPTISPLCPVTDYSMLSGSGRTERTQILAHNLTTQLSTDFSDMSAFTIPENAAHPSNNFCGTLSLEKLDTLGHIEVVQEDTISSLLTDSKLHLPEFSQSFIQHGSHLIPTVFGVQMTLHPNWEIMVGAGRVWDEKDDNTWSRSSFPFTLVERNNDCTHNGVMTFLFKNGGMVSNVAYEIAQETCSSFKANFWGTVPASYGEEILDSNIDPAKLQTSYENEVTSRIKMKPIEELSNDYGRDHSKFGNQDDITMYAFDVDGTSYVGGFDTRAGKYPYPGKLYLNVS